MHDLAQIGATWAESISADLSGLVDKEISISGPDITEAPLDRVLGAKGSVALTPCSLQGDQKGDLAFAMPLESALSLASVQLGRGPGDLAGGALDGEGAEAFKNVMDLCVGILGRVFDEEASLPGLALGESATLDRAADDTGSLTAGDYRCARFALAIDGDSAGAVDLLIPTAIATEWFGAADAAPQAEAGEGDVGVIDPGFVDREEIDALGDGLGHKVVTIDVADFGPDIADDLSDCRALILGWDLGGRNGLDVLEALHRNPRLATLRIAMASEAPTPAMVAAAMRWGAFTFLAKPYEADEIRTRLIDPSD